MRRFARSKLFDRIKHHKKLIAMTVGILLAATPLVAFDFWLDDVVERQGQDDVNALAKRAIAIAETRAGQVVVALDRLAGNGVESCRGGSIDLMRQAAFSTPAIKEVSVVAANGRTLCTHLGLLLGERKVEFSEQLPNTPDYSLDVVVLGPARTDRFARLRRPSGAADGTSVAAMIPADLFLPLVDNQGGLFSAYAEMSTQDGSTIVETGTKPQDLVGLTAFMSNIQSDRFGFNVTLSMPRSAVVSNRGDLNKLSLFVPAAIAILIMGLASLVPRRQPPNPVLELQRAIEAGELVPYYQPIVDIRSGQLQGAEVLVRWKKPDGTIVLPASFIPLAESSGLILDLTRALMKRVCLEAGPSLATRPAMKIGFNFAAKLFADDSIVKEVRNIFAGSPISMSQVVLEVTERDPIENFTETRRVIAALQSLGLRIAIDDVGTGHSGLSYMLKLGVDIIKIDKIFVDSIGTDRNSTTIVETLVDLAHNMRMDIIAEGVENFEQVVHLRELGIRSAQGYVFAPPLPGRAFLRLVDAIDPAQPTEAVERKVAGAARRYMSARKRFGAA